MKTQILEILNKLKINSFLYGHPITIPITEEESNIDEIAEEVVKIFYNSIVKPVDKDNLPKEPVLCYDIDNNIAIGILYNDSAYTNDWFRCKDKNGKLLDGITHYMEIPKIKNDERENTGNS